MTGAFMEYNDEQLMTINDYEMMAKAYASELKKRGFMVVRIDEERNFELIQYIFVDLIKIKSQLFMLGGFLNTSKFYSLNERHLKKLITLFDIATETPSFSLPKDKTKCFLSFLSTECDLLKKLFELTDKSNYESELKKIIDARLTILSEILSI